MLCVLTRIQRRFRNADAHAILTYAGYVVAQTDDFGGVGKEGEEIWGGIDWEG